MKDEFDAKMLGRVGSGQLTEAKSLKRTVRRHEQEMCFLWAGGTRHVTEPAVLPGRTDTRAVTKRRTPGPKATNGGACDALEALEAFQAAIVLDRPDRQYAVKAARSATTEPTKLDWMRMMRLAKFLTAHDELEWLHQARDVPEKYVVYGDPEGSGQDARRSTTEAVEQLGQHLIESSRTTQSVISLPSGETVLYVTGRAAAGVLNSVQLLTEAGMELKLEWLWTQDIGASHKGKGEGKSKEKDLGTNHDAEVVCYHCHPKDHRERDCEALERGKDRKGVNAAEDAPALTPAAAGAPSLTPSRVNRIELDDWILAVSLEEHEKVV